ncbi:ATP-binding protein [Jatrophihabitans cynanchi]|uniref:ATP-binding protein n=1 Tax=Jatrophihabitans cynanchi TaxID=2944128 RepID=A0ABY7JWQ4_9ACTN|nr:AAA family ATPase [Jatrophihabitans sp. SB3-54]WAX55742.1 ATP-binding protein [Jatrophihabitans sp. SB3-54]
MAIGGMGQPGMEATGNPIHELFIDGDLESELSKICLKTFNFPLTLDRANGNVQLRVGKPGIDSPPLQHPTREYAESVAALRLLSEQGDGVKNYLGMVLHLMTSRASVTVIDELEAFLHPAQARSLGRHLGTQALSRGLQLLTATHDRDFVLGLLETNCPVTFVRLQRYQDNTSAATLSPERVKSIWDRPLLRYSNVLQGLFHRTVVVCESDGDCRWYAAVLDELGRRADFAAEEVLFVPAGGKSQIPQCVDALEGLDVGAFVAVDFDALLDPPYLKTLLASAGATGDDLLSRATNIVKQLLTTEQRARAKEFGLDGLPHGDLTRLAQDLVADLRDARVLVLPGGELESYDRSIGGHGPAWVSGALAAGRHLASPIAEEFLSPVVAAVRGLE